ncbi:MAG: CorA family divalent cation transporter [Armatimonadota bacterium]
MHLRGDTLRELLSTALEATLSLQSVAQNESMKRLAGLVAIIAVPTAIAGIYGMNFRFMPELDWPWGYPPVLGTTALFCTLLYVRFKRIGWL